MEARHIQQFYTEKLKTVTPNSVIHYHAVIYQALKYAMKTDMVPQNVAMKVDRPRKNSFQPTFLDAEQMQKLFEVVKGTRLELPVLVAAFYGLRRGEVLGLKWDAIDFNRGTLTIKRTVTEATIDGTVQLCDASVHVNGNYSTTPRTFDTVEVVLDEDVRSAEDVRKLGIDVGDFVCFDPRSRITESGYIKSRFLDDKLSVGILQAFAQYLKDENLTPKRRVYVHVTVYEEVGHGGSASVPDGVTEAISVDMGCVGEGVQCTERQVSICAKDSGGPYSYDVVRKLIAAAKREGADYAVDVYPHYGSDVEATLRAGYDIRHGLIGAGVYASHGYERSHRDGALNTLKVIEGYLFE